MLPRASIRPLSASSSGPLARGAAAPARPAEHRPAAQSLVKPSRATMRDMRKKKAAHTSAVLPRVPGKTLLQTASVQAPARKLYLRLLQVVAAFLEVWRLTPTTEASWGQAVADLMDLKYLDGEPASYGSSLLAAVLWQYPWLSAAAGGKMALSRQALRGWQKLVPPRARLPIPYSVAMAVVNEFVLMQEVEAAVVTWLLVETYCRPSEPFLLRARDVAPPAAGARAPHDRMALVLHPLEMELPSKTQEFDESLLLDLRRQEPLAEKLAVMKLNRRDDDLLFALAPARFFKLLGMAEQRLQLGVLGALHPYRLRHTGASHDFASSARDLPSVQRRISELLQRLPPAMQRHAAQCERHVGAVVLGQRSPCRVR